MDVLAGMCTASWCFSDLTGTAIGCTSWAMGESSCDSWQVGNTPQISSSSFSNVQLYHLFSEFFGCSCLKTEHLMACDGVFFTA